MASEPSNSGSDSGGDGGDGGDGGGAMARITAFLKEPLGMGLVGGIALALAIGWVIL